MLAVATLRHTKDEGHGDMNAFSIPVLDDFPDFADGNLLDSIDFDDLFAVINIDGEELPDMEMDPELLASFSISTGGEGSNMNMSGGIFEDATGKEEEDSGSGSGSSEESVSRGEEFPVTPKTSVSNKDAHEKGRKTSTRVKNSHHGKRKVKVDWTPELHRRFVQAVEQLGVDKAVPSRILEIMGIDCLTRHNIASHLQKYRSHRKHLQAREAEAASWSQRRQMYSAAPSGGGGGKREMNPWLAPTMGFPPPMTPPPPQPMHPHFRPLHVWGHPSLDQSHMNMWPKHLPHSPPPPPPSWAPPRHPPPSHDPSYWHPHHQRVPNGIIQGAHCFSPSPLATTRFGSPHVPVPGIPPHAMYKIDPGRVSPAGQSGGSQPLLDLLPSKESIDAAIGDVILKPWLPLPLGLKPPSLDGVLVELQRQGVPKIPPTTTFA